MEYPKWRYHATEKAQIVNDPEHEDAAAPEAEGWANHPDQLKPAEPVDDQSEPEAKPKRKR
jgi:hypothetical protein